MGDPWILLKIAIFSILQKALAAHHKMAVAASLPTYGIAPGAFSLPRRTSAHASTSSPRGFDVIAAYQRALEDQEVDDNPTLLLSFPCSDASGCLSGPTPDSSHPRPRRADGDLDRLDRHRSSYRAHPSSTAPGGHPAESGRTGGMSVVGALLCSIRRRTGGFFPFSSSIRQGKV